MPIRGTCRNRTTLQCLPQLELDERPNVNEKAVQDIVVLGDPDRKYD